MEININCTVVDCNKNKLELLTLILLTWRIWWAPNDVSNMADGI
jgi:hypothetical protein